MQRWLPACERERERTKEREEEEEEEEEEEGGGEEGKGGSMVRVCDPTTGSWSGSEMNCSRVTSE